MKLNISITAVFLYLLTGPITAQDIHLSQYHFDRLQINPALTGVFNGDKQVVVLHKQQYFSVPVDYLTFSASFDMKIRKSQNDDGFFSVGALFNYDQSGDSRLSLGGLSINGSYTKVLTKNIFGSFGAYLGGGQRAFKESGLRWGNQWDGTMFNMGLPSGESFSRTNFFFLDLGAGANIRIQGRDRTKFDLGVGTFHLNRPNYAFYKASDVRLPIRAAIHGLGVLKLANRLDLYANGLLHTHGPYKETLVGGGVIIHVSNKRAREVELHLGVASRLEDALIPMIAIGYDGWKGGFSYDINTSPFKIATDKKGGPEFFLMYTYKKLWPLEQTKVCSIF